jgi:hypothetical protein
LFIVNDDAHVKVSLFDILAAYCVSGAVDVVVDDLSVNDAFHFA